MQCPECERLRAEAAAPVAAGDAAVGAADSAALKCPGCRTQEEDSAAALLRLLTQLANCGLTAEAPPVLRPLRSRT